MMGRACGSPGAAPWARKGQGTKVCQGWIKCPKVSTPGLKSLAVFNFLFFIFIKEKEVGGVFPDYHIIMSMEKREKTDGILVKFPHS